MLEQCYKFSFFVSMELVLTSILTFATTNIDDIFILTLFYGNKRFSNREILAGQFLGISVLIIISLVTSLIGLIVHASYIGFLGLFPIYLGLKALWNYRKKDNYSVLTPGAGKVYSQYGNVLSVAGVTITNGGDNTAIYVPLFATLEWPHKLTMVSIFLVMPLVWCGLAKYLTKHPLVSKAVEKYGHWLSPFVLILLGIYIIYESESFALVLNN